MNEGFIMTPDIALLFFRICSRYKIDDLDDRTCLMRELTRRKKVKYIRDVTDYTKGKKVLHIKRGKNV